MEKHFPLCASLKSSFKILLSSLTISGELVNESGGWETSFHNSDLKSKQVTPLQRDVTQSRQLSGMDEKLRLTERRSQEVLPVWELEQRVGI